MPGHPLAKRGAPHWPPYRPSDAPPGPMATASPTGHLLAIREAPTGHWTGATSPVPPPTGKRDGRGRLWPHGSSSPPLPGHLWPKGSHTTHWPPTGHLRSTWPSEAFGHLPPHRPIEAFGRGGPHPYRLAKGATRLATHWPKRATGHLLPPLATPLGGRTQRAMCAMCAMLCNPHGAAITY